MTLSEKAFDRTSRHYLLALLRHIGAPSWVINLLVTLFENVVALPILAGPHSTRIQMTNGLKQGCPLSPLLFCLALDPLISAITKCHIDVRAYVDDIACGSPAIAPLALALPHFDRFNAASGSATSHTKSGLIATGSLSHSAIAAPAKDRRPAQCREFLALLAALPPRSWCVFSDGSSFDSTRAARWGWLRCY